MCHNINYFNCSLPSLQSCYWPLRVLLPLSVANPYSLCHLKRLACFSTKNVVEFYLSLYCNWLRRLHLIFHRRRLHDRFDPRNLCRGSVDFCLNYAGLYRLLLCSGTSTECCLSCTQCDFFAWSRSSLQYDRWYKHAKESHCSDPPHLLSG